jgi:hypothetical protein
MMSKKNAALSVLGAVSAAPSPQQSTPTVGNTPPSDISLSANRAVGKVMLYLPPKVARKFKEIAFHEECKAHDVYLRALEAYLRQNGHVAEADLIRR